MDTNYLEKMAKMIPFSILNDRIIQSDERWVSTNSNIILWVMRMGLDDLDGHLDLLIINPLY